jgi:mono/diheme cytochrome c family protein
MRRLPTLALAALAAGILLAIVAIVAWGAGREQRVKGLHGQTIELTQAQARGRELFVASCSACHRLRAANAVGQVGPDLDFVRPPAAVVLRRIAQGSQASSAVMPARIVTGREAADVAAFVARVAGR